MNTSVWFRLVALVPQIVVFLHANKIEEEETEANFFSKQLKLNRVFINHTASVLRHLQTYG